MVLEVKPRPAPGLVAVESRKSASLVLVLALMGLSCSRLLVLGEELGLEPTGSGGRVREVSSFVPASVEFVTSAPLNGGATVLAFAGDGGLTVVLDGPAPTVTRATVGGARGLAATSHPAPTVWVATARGLELFRVASEGELVAEGPVPVPFRVDHLRRLSASTVAAWDATRLAVVQRDAGLFVSAPFAGELFDVARFEAGLSFPDGGRDGDEALVAFTSEGALATPVERPGRWHPVSFEKSGVVVLRRLAMESSTGRVIGLMHAPNQGYVVLGAVGLAPNRDQTWLATPTGEVVQFGTSARPPCARIEALRAGPGLNDRVLFCRVPDGGLAETSASEVVEPLDPGLTTVSDDGRLLAGPGRAAWFDGRGALVPLTPDFDRVRALFGRASQPVLVIGGVDAGLPTRQVVCATRKTPWLWCEEGGSAAMRVHGRPEWAVDSSVSGWDLDTGAPTSRVTEGVAGLTAVAFLNDTLVAGAGRELLRGVPWGSVTTLPVGPITGLAARSSDELFAVAGGQVFSVVKDGGWSVSPLEVTEVLHVWSDGPRGRVLLRDGSVRLFPTGQEVVAPTAERFRTAESFCGQTFALSTTGLFRLDVATPDATWERMDLGPVPSSAFTEARLLAEENSLFVLLPGTTPRLVEGFGCAQ